MIKPIDPVALVALLVGAGIGSLTKAVPSRLSRGGLPLITLLTLSSLRADDWPMLGGRPDRNMVSGEVG